ncbi:hypothetical protein MIR68_002758 [Amoeboaphelidium protococcarum]|nr:hypothetical protein MIR68_002758 [Amoeboaphelidium protococcarum]
MLSRQMRARFLKSLFIIVLYLLLLHNCTELEPNLHQQVINIHRKMPQERTYIMVKPDGVQRGLVGEIIKRFENRGFQLLAMKMTHPNANLLEEHYKDLKGKGFFAGLIKYMSSGPVVAMVWSGKGVVKTGRMMLGATNPLDSQPGTIRGDFCIDVGRNIVHGSDSVESAEREIKLWFSEGVLAYERSIDKQIYE